MRETLGLLGFLILPLAAVVALLQSWLAHGRPDYGRPWLLYAIGPAIAIGLIEVIGDSVPAGQLVVDLLNALWLFSLVRGTARFARTVGVGAWNGVLPALAVVSGVVALIAPAGRLAITTGTWLWVAAYALALGALAAPPRSDAGRARSDALEPDVREIDLRLARIPLVIGLGVSVARLAADTVAAYVDYESVFLVRTISGFVFLCFLVYHAFSLAGLIQRRAYRSLVESNQRLDRALYDRRMNRLVASLAHRFGTPVFALRSVLPIIRDEVSALSGASPALRESIDHASAASDRLSRIVTQFRLLWGDGDEDYEQAIPVGELFCEVSSLELTEGSAVIEILRDDGVALRGPYRRTLQLFAVVIDYLIELGVCGAGQPLRVSVITEGGCSRIELGRLQVEPETVRAMLAGEGVRLEAEATVRGLTYARERLAELYRWRELVVPDAERGSRLVIELPAASLAR